MTKRDQEIKEAENALNKASKIYVRGTFNYHIGLCFNTKEDALNAQKAICDIFPEEETLFFQVRKENIQNGFGIWFSLTSENTGETLNTHKLTAESHETESSLIMAHVVSIGEKWETINKELFLHLFYLNHSGLYEIVDNIQEILNCGCSLKRANRLVVNYIE